MPEQRRAKAHWTVTTRDAGNGLVEAVLRNNHIPACSATESGSARPKRTAKENAVARVLLYLPGKLRASVPVDP